MTHVVTDSCIKCKYTDCVEVCPVDCFHEGPGFLVIDPDECIDCAVCIPECPANAIFAEEDLPADQLAFIKLNAELALADGWTNGMHITSPAIHTGVLFTAQLSGFGLLWIAQFIVLDRVLFADPA